MHNQHVNCNIQLVTTISHSIISSLTCYLVTRFKSCFSGSGAFGKVYEGRWHPAENLNTTDNKGFRVAIKILKDSGDPESTREFFDVGSWFCKFLFSIELSSISQRF